MANAEQQARETLEADFPFYAEECLTIRPKEGGAIPLILNEAQEHIHNRIEAQQAELGKVRALVLKGRQQGASTYTEARYYHKVTHRMGARAFILTHEADSTSSIFEMVQ